MPNPQFAGQYGPEGFSTYEGRPARRNPVTVITVTGELAVLYANKEKQGIVANPTETDAMGNLTFWTEPGEYALMVDNELYPIMVHPHPTDPALYSARENPVVDWFHGEGDPIIDNIVEGAGRGDMYRDDATGDLYQLR